MGSEASEGFLEESLTVVDARSLYDHLSKEDSVGGQDRQTAIEIQRGRDQMGRSLGHAG